MTTYIDVLWICHQCGVWKPKEDVRYYSHKDALDHVINFHGHRVRDTLLLIPGVTIEQLLSLALRDCRADEKRAALQEAQSAVESKDKEVSDEPKSRT